MKNGIINIEVFEAMDNISIKYGKKAIDWAKATWGKKANSSRISELRLKVQMHRINPRKKTGRAFTAQKCSDLIRGLKKMLGEEIVTRELKTLLDKARNPTERMLLMILAIPEEEQERIETIIKAVILKDK